MYADQWNYGRRSTNVVGVGYQPPAVQIDNDPIVGGMQLQYLRAHTETWPELVCSAVSQSRYLRRFEFYDDDGNTLELISSFFKRLAKNRSIEHLNISWMNMGEVADDVDIFEILVPFFGHNRNLCCIQVQSSNVLIPSLISALDQSSRIGHLEQIELSSNNIEDEMAGDLINAINSMPGLCLSDLAWNATWSVELDVQRLANC